MANSATIVFACSAITDLLEGGGDAWTALCDLEATCLLGEVNPAVAVEKVTALRSILEAAESVGLSDEKQARLIIGTLGIIQGQCPVETWTQWARLNGC